MSRLIMLTLVSSAVLLGACAAATESSGSAGGATDNAALAGMVFEAHVPPGAAPQTGDFRITFTEAGRMLVHQQGRNVYEGEYEVRGGELRITNRRGSYGCSGRAAVYNWTLADRLLTLNRRDDPCTTMGAVFPAARWEQR